MKRMCFAFLAVASTLPSYASSLTGAYVFRVQSAAGGNEYVEGKSTTVNDHGGAWMQITTDDIGYGKAAQAKLLSNALREIKTEPLCKNGNAVGPCRRGETIIGYRRTWDANGHQGGNFEYAVYPATSGKEQRVTFQVR
ncbi:DUF4879 domain-containing protein [Luteibacter pinisoli]|uniref:DUF4879 domain-containing protein n=1 Tax=Luteibacter pinisoli TaxID=2589080 RepID=A0A4Y5Z8U5_9GAMM|nr:DUF4879 domain-containing protein [Luteibacter pinisoli]QDE40765.1 DUF4879 domain-containing protein [Luteibacter pinisoli]